MQSSTAEIDTEVVLDTESQELAGCVYSDAPGSIDGGLEFQCKAEYEVLLFFTFTPYLGAPQPDFASVSVDDTSIESTYEDPFVMACCSELDPLPVDTCTTPHHQACYSDLIEHVCQTVVQMLWSKGKELDPGSSAFEDAHDWIKQRTQECYDHFWNGTDSLRDADKCTEGHIGHFVSDDWILDEPFAGDLFGADVYLDRVQLTTRLPADAVQALPTSPESCMLPDSNDGEIPPGTIAGTSGAFATPVATYAASVIGPAYAGQPIAGTGAFSTDSEMHRYFASGGSLVVDSWTMVESGPATIGNSAASETVESFGLRLVDQLTPTKSSGIHTVAPGAAHFGLSAVTDGHGYPLQATNSSKLQFVEVATGVAGCPVGTPKCLQSRAFTIEFMDDAGATWELDIATATWKP